VINNHLYTLHVLLTAAILAAAVLRERILEKVSRLSCRLQTAKPPSPFSADRTKHMIKI